MNIQSNLTRLRNEMAHVQRLPEAQLLPAMTESVLDTAPWPTIETQAQRLIEAERTAAGAASMAALLNEYPLSSPAGLALLALAECCLRVPDRHTLNLLIHDKLARHDWRRRSRHTTSLLSTAIALGLRTSKWLLREPDAQRGLLQRATDSLIGSSSLYAMRQLGKQFVFDSNMGAALRRARRAALTCSFDMLGEAARSADDAARYFDAYQQAIEAVATDTQIHSRPQHSVSIKLSALHPRYEVLQAREVVPVLVERLELLAQLAMNHDIELTIDAEECDRLELSLDVVEHLLARPSLRNWAGLSMAVQAYQKRAPRVIEWLEALAAARQQRIGVRLVKGAYWDTEIKRCQQRGLHDFPVYTRKAATDVSYLACARQLLASEHLRPTFATHNALTIATLLSWLDSRRDIEFQRLHGMAAGAYELVTREHGLPCRVYAPVGPHAELLPYLIRRMLENGANSSFVQQLHDPTVSMQALLKNPVDSLREAGCTSHPGITRPADLYGPARRNSTGLDLHDRQALNTLTTQLEPQPEFRTARPTGAGLADSTKNGSRIALHDPANPQTTIGEVIHATQSDVAAAISSCHAATSIWSSTPVETRCQCLERTAELLEQHRAELMRLLLREAGKTRSDAVSEVREAVDFCRYYAQQARQLLAELHLPGPSGELNLLNLRARGLFACISPWNFPLSIFLGQISVALVTGNCVIAKPAPQTPLIAALAIQLLYQAGIPSTALACLPGGAEVGEWLVGNRRIAGIAFTGSTHTARRIAQQVLQDERRPLTALIAETGGINSMIVDSTALPEQVVTDVIASAFQSAGQRCSALRLLCLQDEIYDRTLALLTGAMAELKVGKPLQEDTDVGPLIDATAVQRVQQYLAQHAGQILYSTPLADSLSGWFVAPTLVAVKHPQDLQEEIFGPVLHVTRWQAGHLDELIETLNATGYGLTLGLHSRLESAANLVRARARVGNIYINRSMIGAVVGSQPFGGEGLSGTGPKAGGPNYLVRFCTERTVSVDTTAAGGNAGLLNLE